MYNITCIYIYAFLLSLILKTALWKSTIHSITLLILKTQVIMYKGYVMYKHKECIKSLLKYNYQN